MTPQEIFVLQFLLSLVVTGLLARWTLAPWLDSLPQRKALFWLTVPHAFRHVGMVFLVPGVVAQPLPEGFAVPAAYGDLVTGLLALLALVLLRTGWAGALALVWLFNVVGTVDLLNALTSRERSTRLRSNVVHTDIVGSSTARNALHDIRSTAEERSFLTVRSNPAGRQTEIARVSSGRILREVLFIGSPFRSVVRVLLEWDPPVSFAPGSSQFIQGTHESSAWNFRFELPASPKSIR